MITSPLSSPPSPRQPEFLAYQHRFVNYLRNPNPEQLADVLPPNVNIYAKLLQRKIDGSLRSCFPITRSLLGTGRWDVLVKTFIRDHPCQSPLYREIPDEFIDFLVNENPLLEALDFIVDLAHFEWMELVLETAQPLTANNSIAVAGDFLDNIPVLNSVLHLLRYRYPVQTVTAGNERRQSRKNRSKTEKEQAVLLVGLRDDAFRIRFIEVNPVTARLIELLQEGIHTGRNALIQVATELHYPSPESILPFGKDILDNMASQQILIGVNMKYNYPAELDDSAENTLMHRFCEVMQPTAVIATYQKITALLNDYSDKLPPLLLRLILAYEFWEAGMMKYGSENWFNQLTFPFPFNLFSVESLWAMTTWLELTGAIALLLGLGTRLVTLAMMILTAVAINTVHWPAEWHSLAELGKGYAITDAGYGNFKLPLIYLIMSIPLLFGGAGKWSADFVVKRFFNTRQNENAEYKK